MSTLFTPESLFEFLRKHQWAVQASVNAERVPQAAVIGVALTSERELVFDTQRLSRKAQNLRATPNIALVIGWDDAQTAQLEGTVDEPTGLTLERLQRTYFEKFPDGVERARTDDVTYFRVKITWARFSDFRKTPPFIVEWTGEQLI